MSKDNQGSIFIASFSEQLIREKVMMDEPKWNPEVWDFRNEFDFAVKKYKEHLASRRTFPYPVKEEQDGKEIPESELRLQHQMTTFSKEIWYDCTKAAYKNTLETHRRIIAIPIEPEKRQYLGEQWDELKNPQPDTPLQPVKDEDSIRQELQDLFYGISTDEGRHIGLALCEDLADEAMKIFKRLSSPPEPAPLKEGLPDQKEGETSFEFRVKADSPKKYGWYWCLVKAYPIDYALGLAKLEYCDEGWMQEDDNFIITHWLEKGFEPFSKEQEAVCSHCGDIIEHPLCRNCEIALTLPDNEY